MKRFLHFLIAVSTGLVICANISAAADLKLYCVWYKTMSRDHGSSFDDFNNFAKQCKRNREYRMSYSKRFSNVAGYDVYMRTDEIGRAAAPTQWLVVKSRNGEYIPIVCFEPEFEEVKLRSRGSCIYIAEYISGDSGDPAYYCYDISSGTLSKSTRDAYNSTEIEPQHHKEYKKQPERQHHRQAPPKPRHTPRHGRHHR